MMSEANKCATSVLNHVRVVLTPPPLLEVEVVIPRLDGREHLHSHSVLDLEIEITKYIKPSGETSRCRSGLCQIKNSGLGDRSLW